MDWSLLFELTQAYGVSGNEDDVRDIILRELEKSSRLQIHVDTIGNVYAYLPSSSSYSYKTLLLTSHMDEVGLIVRHIDEETGHIYVNALASSSNFKYYWSEC